VDVRKYFFGNRVVKIWNSLPATMEDFASLRKFKSFTERVDLSQYIYIYIYIYSFLCVLSLDVKCLCVCVL